MIETQETNTTPVADTAARGTPIEVAVARLRAAGLRITQPRIAILNALIRREQPASIEQIHNDLKGNTFCDLVTVYRCLAAFEELGLVRRCFFHNGTSLWQINLAGETTYHVVCKVNNTMEQLDPQTSAELNAAIKRVEDVLQSRGYSEISHMVEFFGISPGANKPAAAPVA
ncbi:MAG TPA: transcriptional repressor [Opitutaceae bacterium]|nr:transcriptional repressor [Opitutaceae bacterium]